MVTVYILIWFAYIFGDVCYNTWIIEEKKQRPDYLQLFIVRGFAAILHGILFDPQNEYDYLPVFIFQVTSFFTFFNPILNGFRDKPFWYLGKSSGWIDKFLFDKPVFYQVIYFMSFILMVLSIVVLVSNWW